LICIIIVFKIKNEKWKKYGNYHNAITIGLIVFKIKKKWKKIRELL